MRGGLLGFLGEPAVIIVKTNNIPDLGSGGFDDLNVFEFGVHAVYRARLKHCGLAFFHGSFPAIYFHDILALDRVMGFMLYFMILPAETASFFYEEHFPNVLIIVRKPYLAAPWLFNGLHEYLLRTKLYAQRQLFPDKRVELIYCETELFCKGSRRSGNAKCIKADDHATGICILIPALRASCLYDDCSH